MRVLHRDHPDGTLRQQPLEHTLRAAEGLLRLDTVGHVDGDGVDRVGFVDVAFRRDVDLEPPPEELDDLHHRFARERALEQRVDLGRVTEIVGDRTPHRVAWRDRVVELDRPGPQVGDHPGGRDPQRGDPRLLEHVQQPLLAGEQCLLQAVEVGEIVDEGADDRLVRVDQELVDEEGALPRRRAHRDHFAFATAVLREPAFHGGEACRHHRIEHVVLGGPGNRTRRLAHDLRGTRARVQVAPTFTGEDDPRRRAVDDAPEHRGRHVGEVAAVERVPVRRRTLVLHGRHGANGTPVPPGQRTRRSVSVRA